MVTYDYPNYTESVVNYESWYLNDKINLSKKLTLNAGVRYDFYSNYLPAQGNPGQGPFVGQTGTPQGTGVAPENPSIPRSAISLTIHEVEVSPHFRSLRRPWRRPSCAEGKLRAIWRQAAPQILAQRLE